MSQSFLPIWPSTLARSICSRPVRFKGGPQYVWRPKCASNIESSLTNTRTQERVRKWCASFMCCQSNLSNSAFSNGVLLQSSGTVWLLTHWERLLEDGLTKRTAGGCRRTSPSWTVFAESTPSTRRQVNQSSYTQEGRTNFCHMIFSFFVFSCVYVYIKKKHY